MLGCEVPKQEVPKQEVHEWHHASLRSKRDTLYLVRPGLSFISGVLVLMVLVHCSAYRVLMFSLGNDCAYLYRDMPFHVGMSVTIL